jgi:glycosyltransferase involved in cell wall biosynthesis
LIKNYPNNIKYIGEILDNDKVSLFNNHDFFILPTFSENFGIVLLESLTCGLPIITTKESSWADIEKENLGFFIEANENSIVNCLKKVIKIKPSQYKKLSISSKNYAAKFDWINISKTAKKIYRFHEK